MTDSSRRSRRTCQNNGPLTSTHVLHQYGLEQPVGSTPAASRQTDLNAGQWPVLSNRRPRSVGWLRHLARLKLEVSEAACGGDLAERPDRRTVRGNDHRRILQRLGVEQVHHDISPLSRAPAFLRDVGFIEG
jgi:hypothetical protein